MWKVKYFQTARGAFPVKEFVENQNLDDKARIGKSIRRLINYGPFLKPPQIKKLQKGLYELRIKGSVQIRILYFLYGGEYYLLHAFKKKSQKTPKRELKTGLDRMKELI